MTDLQAIQTRTARRSYAGKLEKQDVMRLEAEVAQVNLDAGLHFRLIEDGAEIFGGVTNSYGLFKGVRSLIIVAGPEKDPRLREKAGRAGERLVLEATKMGLGTCWVSGTFDRAKAAAALSPGQELLAVIAVGPVKEGRGLIERTVGRVAGGKRKGASELAQTDGDAPDWFTAGVEAAAAAPSALGKQPVCFAYKQGVATASVPDEDGSHLIDLGIAKLHFEIAAGGTFALGNHAAFTKEA